jgi:hypothetical protein
MVAALQLRVLWWGLGTRRQRQPKSRQPEPEGVTNVSDQTIDRTKLRSGVRRFKVGV